MRPCLLFGAAAAAAAAVGLFGFDEQDLSWHQFMVAMFVIEIAQFRRRHVVVHGHIGQRIAFLDFVFARFVIGVFLGSVWWSGMVGSGGGCGVGGRGGGGSGGWGGIAALPSSTASSGRTIKDKLAQGLRGRCQSVPEAGHERSFLIAGGTRRDEKPRKKHKI